MEAHVDTWIDSRNCRKSADYIVTQFIGAFCLHSNFLNHCFTGSRPFLTGSTVRLGVGEKLTGQKVTLPLDSNK